MGMVTCDATYRPYRSLAAILAIAISVPCMAASEEEGAKRYYPESKPKSSKSESSEKSSGSNGGSSAAKRSNGSQAKSRQAASQQAANHQAAHHHGMSQQASYYDYAAGSAWQAGYPYPGGPVQAYQYQSASGNAPSWRGMIWPSNGCPGY